MKALLPLPCLLLLASPAFAQEHGSHVDHKKMGQGQASNPTEHAQMPEMDHPDTDHGAMDHGAMDHSTMDHSAMDHAAMGHTAEEFPQVPPPPEAYAGPAFAADKFVGAEKMAASRSDVVREISGMPLFWFQGDRLEFRARQGDNGYLWDVQGFYGGDIDKFWFKSEGEGSFGEEPESAEAQALWSHAIDPFFDLQLGVRQDLVGPERTHAVMGVQGLAPYLFEVDAAAFLSTKGDLTARIEAELDQRITQRLILQPRAEIGLSAQDIPELGIGSGIERIELGVRLRYELVREFAPYVGVEQEWLIGGSADYARASGEDPSTTNFVAGVRFWF